MVWLGFVWWTMALKNVEAAFRLGVYDMVLCGHTTYDQLLLKRLCKSQSTPTVPTGVPVSRTSEVS